jgi:hypothetical protein
MQLHHLQGVLTLRLLMLKKLLRLLKLQLNERNILKCLLIVVWWNLWNVKKKGGSCCLVAAYTIWICYILCLLLIYIYLPLLVWIINSVDCCFVFLFYQNTLNIYRMSYYFVNGHCYWTYTAHKNLISRKRKALKLKSEFLRGIWPP